MLSGPNDNVDFNVQYILDLIGLIKRSPSNFWAGKGAVLPKKAPEEPVGIAMLKSILKHFEEKYPDLRRNEAVLLEFFNTCCNQVDSEMMKLDKKNPNACELYKALIDYDKEKILVLNESRLKILEFDAIAGHLTYDVLKVNRKEFEKDFQTLCRNRRDRPYLLLLQDYLFNAYRSEYINRDIESTYLALKRYVEDVLLEEDSLFLKAFPTPTALALCIRSDAYCPVMHDKKKGWVSYLNTPDERGYFNLKFLALIGYIHREISDKAFSEHFSAIFKDINDVIAFLAELSPSKDPAYNDGPCFDDDELKPILKDLCSAIVNSPKFLKMIEAADQETRKNLYNHLPGLEALIKKKVLSNVSLGLLFAQKQGELRGMDKNLIKKIAGFAADEMGTKSSEASKKLKK